MVVLTPRPIVLLSLVYRIWAAARRPEVWKWVVGAGADGAEEPGRGTDEAAWHLALEAGCLDPAGDLEVEEPEVLCGVFLDCSKCYERASLRQLDVRAVAVGFPDRLLVLALSMYSGRRHVKVGMAVVEARVGSSGIMAGCGLAVALLRAHLREAVMAAQAIGTGGGGGDGAEAVVARPRVRRYVDD